MAKLCWLAKEYKRGWRLGLCIGNAKPAYMDVWFGNEDSVNVAVKSNVVFVHMRKD